jgi:hypothetical protein
VRTATLRLQKPLSTDITSARAAERQYFGNDYFILSRRIVEWIFARGTRPLLRRWLSTAAAQVWGDCCDPVGLVSAYVHALRRNIYSCVQIIPAETFWHTLLLNGPFARTVCAHVDACAFHTPGSPRLA